MKSLFLKGFSLILLVSLSVILVSCRFTQRKVESTYADGKPMKVVYVKNTDAGQETVKIEYYYPNGWLESVTRYKNEKKHGKAKSWYSNGKLAFKEYYKNGELHGKCLYYREDGSLNFQAEYEEGVSDGKWIIYDENGKPLVKQVFENGKLIEQKK